MLLFLLTIASLQSHAVVVANLYNVELLVTDQRTKTRNAAFADGLAEVLIRASGNHAVLDQIRISSASAYVQQFLYKEIDDEEANDGGANKPAARYRLLVRYNPGKIIELLRANAQPVWSEHRNEAVIWLAVRDGSNRYILKRNDLSALKTSVEAVASRRSLPVVWPLYDSRDRQQLTFADVWAAFAGPVNTVSARYSDGPVVIGRLAWNGNQWSGEWSVFIDQITRSWVFTNRDYDALISQAMELSIDEIGGHYAVLDAQVGSGSPDLLVEIEQVNSIAAYRKLDQYLGSLPAVKGVRLVSMDVGGHVVFAVSLRSRQEDFEKLVAIDHTLQQVSVTESIPADPVVQEPAVTDAASVDPAAVQPVVTDPMARPDTGPPVSRQPRLFYRYQP